MEYDKGYLISKICSHEIFNICIKSRNGEIIGKSKMYTSYLI